MQGHWTQDDYIKAYRFAAQAHQGQIVPGTDLPYIMHLSFVSMEVIAALLTTDGYDGNLVVQCALLHDVIEDTPTTYEQVNREFGTHVAEGVLALSKDKTLAKHQATTQRSVDGQTGRSHNQSATPTTALDKSEGKAILGRSP